MQILQNPKGKERVRVEGRGRGKKERRKRRLKPLWFPALQQRERSPMLPGCLRVTEAQGPGVEQNIGGVMMFDGGFSRFLNV